ncbi:MAG: nuclear transport factor 2 family protein [Blastocatellia bacterium]
MPTNVELAKRMVEIFNSNVFYDLAEVLAEDARHTCPGSDFGAELQGRQAIIDYFQQGVITAFDKVSFDIVNLYEDASQSTVIIEWRSHIFPKSGKNYSNTGAFFIVCKDGKIVWVREYFDTELSNKMVN